MSCSSLRQSIKGSLGPGSRRLPGSRMADQIPFDAFVGPFTPLSTELLNIVLLDYWLKVQKSQVFASSTINQILRK